MNRRAFFARVAAVLAAPLLGRLPKATGRIGAGPERRSRSLEFESGRWAPIVFYPENNIAQRRAALAQWVARHLADEAIRHWNDDPTLRPFVDSICMTWTGDGSMLFYWGNKRGKFFMGRMRHDRFLSPSSFEEQMRKCTRAMARDCHHRTLSGLP